MWGDVFMSSNDSDSMVKGYPVEFAPFGWITQGTSAVPDFYWNVVSNEQRWKFLCINLNAIVNFTNNIVIEINKIQSVSPDDLDNLRTELNDKLHTLQDLIKSLDQTTLIWDVQHGNLTSSTNAMRDMFNDVTVHAITVKKLNTLNMTVKELADCGLNVRGLAVMSYYLIDKFDLSDDFKFNTYTGASKTLTAKK